MVVSCVSVSPSVVEGVVVVVMVVGITQLSFGPAVELGEANAGGNVEGLADLMFSRYVFVFEVTAALLITAAVGAMVLAHRERLTPRRGQAQMAADRVRAYAESGTHPGPLPAPGVYARHNAVDTPALLPDGRPAVDSISRVLAARGTARTAGLDDIKAIKAQLGVTPDATPETAGRSGATASTEEQADHSNDGEEPTDD